MNIEAERWEIFLRMAQAIGGPGTEFDTQAVLEAALMVGVFCAKKSKIGAHAFAEMAKRAHKIMPSTAGYAAVVDKGFFQ
jgi:hypothetical protein